MIACGVSEAEDGDFVVSADRPTEQISDPAAVEIEAAPNRAAYIDERIAADVNVIFSEQQDDVVYAKVENKDYSVQLRGSAGES